MTPLEFKAFATTFVKELAIASTIIRVEMTTDAYGREVEFSVKARLKEDTKPDFVVDK